MYRLAHLWPWGIPQQGQAEKIQLGVALARTPGEGQHFEPLQRVSLRFLFPTAPFVIGQFAPLQQDLRRALQITCEPAIFFDRNAHEFASTVERLQRTARMLRDYFGYF